ncbi:MAG: threonine dehydratase [Psychromonas sp.]
MHTSFDNNEAITGSATLAKEILEEIPEIQAINPPVGRRGFLSGTRLSVRYFGYGWKVYASEHERATEVIYSFKNG